MANATDPAGKILEKIPKNRVRDSAPELSNPNCFNVQGYKPISSTSLTGLIDHLMVTQNCGVAAQSCTNVACNPTSPAGDSIEFCSGINDRVERPCKVLVDGVRQIQAACQGVYPEGENYILGQYFGPGKEWNVVVRQKGSLCDKPK
ncbi:hypothetical protein HYFRA_00004379 [Hymenoscyphus fraxineus]|uniref:Uncharacterized protein n=1 Tax=Hymenoscyphus fraxineus TaxID=746836 RepID=A0A9N9KYT9_9HELO|nr:hypothetical protein HYFRA_00004379 [Hymenoscyphus fraxineus]